MAQKTLSGLILIVIFSLISVKAVSSSNQLQVSLDVNVTDGITKDPVKGNLDPHKSPYYPGSASKKQGHSKSHSSHMDELAHIHKFHKERVKKIKKHHDKYWLLSKILLILCHVSILIMAFLHATH